MSQGLGTISRMFAGFAVWSLPLCATHAQEAQPATTSSDPTVAIVIDDTQVRAGDGARIADLVDMLERDVLGPAGTFGFVTVGPAGFIIDLTRERQHLRTLSAAARTGRLEFKGPASPAAEAAARLVSVESVISGLATRPVRRPSWSWGALLMSQANSASHGKPYAATRSQHESL